MQASRIARLALAFGAAASVNGCGLNTALPTLNLGSDGKERQTDTEVPAAQSSQRMEEAPEVFHLTAEGLWDGRPSLGGVWVAHPDTTDPERVVIRNTANDATVRGALFRRERKEPGPPFQVSSAAASALGLLAGKPTVLEVTALRETAPEPAASEAAADAPHPAETAPRARPADAENASPET